MYKSFRQDKKRITLSTEDPSLKLGGFHMFQQWKKYLLKIQDILEIVYTNDCIMTRQKQS